MNIIVSGWPGAGSSTIAILLSYLLKCKYLYAGMVMRKIADLRGYSLEGTEFVKFLKNEGDEFDKKADKKIKEIFESNSNIVLDSKIHGFFDYQIAHKKIFLIADYEVRSSRISKQGRKDAGELLKERQEEDRNRYVSLYGFDTYDMEKIKSTYDLVIDSSKETASKTLEKVLNYLELSTKKDLLKLEKDYWDNGKESFIKKLDEEGLLYDVLPIAQDVVDSYKK